MLNKKTSIILLFLSNLFFLMNYGNFENSGIFESQNIDLNIGKNMIANGKFIGTKSINLKIGESFTGNGVIVSPNIKITTKKFDFNGTIFCDNECVIITKEQFNAKMFKQQGKGKFIIKHDPNLIIFEESSSNLNNTSLNAADKNKPTSCKIELFGFNFSFDGIFAVELAESIKNGDLTKAKSLLNKSNGMRFTDKDTFLLLAGLYGHVSLVEDLVSLGANVNARFKLFNPFICYAAYHNCHDFVKALLRLGADVNAKDKDWNTPLIYAANQGHTEIVATLLEKGADVNMRNKDFLKAINFADKKEIVELLNKKS